MEFTIKDFDDEITTVEADCNNLEPFCEHCLQLEPCDPVIESGVIWCLDCFEASVGEIPQDIRDKITIESLKNKINHFTKRIEQCREELNSFGKQKIESILEEK